MRKYGVWIDKKKPLQELKELGQGGWSARLFKAFNKVDMPCALFTIFCQGGVDFVGGFVMNQFIQKPLFDLNGVEEKMGNLKLSESHGVKTGEEVHQLIF